MKSSLLSINRKSKISKKAKVLSFCRFYESSIGDYSYIGRNSNIINTQIGKYCCIAPGSKIGVANHPIEMISISPIFYNKKNIFKKSYCEKDFVEVKKTIIGNDVWIGSNVIIKSGVKIGNGAIVGAGAVVTKDVGDYEIVGGVPAKVIKKRFNDNEIKKLLEIGWWNWNEDKIKKIAKNFYDINKFFKKVEDEK